MKELLGKIVKVTYKEPAQSGSTRDSFPTEGRVVKLFKKDNRILVANPECQTEADISSNGPNGDVFKWGTWVDMDDANIEVIDEQA